VRRRSAPLLALGVHQQKPLVGVELSAIDLAHTPQLRQVLWPLFAQQVRLAGVVAQQLARSRHLEAFDSCAQALLLAAGSLGLLVDAGHADRRCDTAAHRRARERRRRRRRRHKGRRAQRERAEQEEPQGGHPGEVFIMNQQI